jgi:hypothetical protein
MWISATHPPGSNGPESLHTSPFTKFELFSLQFFRSLNPRTLRICFHLSTWTMDDFMVFGTSTSPRLLCTLSTLFPFRDLGYSRTSSALLAEFCAGSSATLLGLKTFKVPHSSMSFSELSHALLEVSRSPS